MPTYQITAPDGRTFEITAPEGTSKVQLMNYARAQFAKSAPIAQKEMNLDPTEGMSGTQRFLAGVGKGMTDSAMGVGQLLGLVDQKDIDEAKRLDKALTDTTAGTVGNVAGQIAAFAPTALIPGANTVKGAALINGLASAVMTPGEAEERLKSGAFGAAGGAGGVALGNAINSGGKLASAAAAPFTEKGRNKIVGEVMRRAAGDNVDDVIARMKGAQELVPGSLPTAAEVADSGGISALQRAMSAANNEAYTSRGLSNNAARIEALQGIAKDEQAMQAAIAARKAAADPLYRAADAAVVQSDDQLRAIMARLPNGTLEQAQNIARMSGNPIKMGKDIPASVRQVRLDTLTNTPIMQASAGSNASYTGRGIDLIKKAIDDVVDANPTAAIGKNQRAAGLGVKNDLVDWADNAIPEYGQARQAWADGSVPITQMQVGQELLNKLQPALVKYDPTGVQYRTAGNSYATALNDARGNLVKNATGGMRRNLEDVMTPDQMMTLNNIGADLSRAAKISLGQGPGSNTFQNFAMDNMASSVGMPSGVSAIANVLPGLNMAKAIGGVLYKSKDELMKKQMADTLLDPRLAASVMEGAVQPGRIGQAFNSALGNDGTKRAVELMGAAPGVFGAAFALPYGSQQ